MSKNGKQGRIELTLSRAGWALTPLGRLVHGLHLACFGGWFIIYDTNWTMSSMHRFVEVCLLHI